MPDRGDAIVFQPNRPATITARREAKVLDVAREIFSVKRDHLEGQAPYKFASPEQKAGLIANAKEKAKEIANRFVGAVESRNAAELQKMLTTSKPTLRALFEKLTGVPLGRTNASMAEALGRYTEAGKLSAPNAGATVAAPQSGQSRSGNNVGGQLIQYFRTPVQTSNKLAFPKGSGSLLPDGDAEAQHITNHESALLFESGVARQYTDIGNSTAIQTPITTGGTALTHATESAWRLNTAGARSIEKAVEIASENGIRMPSNVRFASVASSTLNHGELAYWWPISERYGANSMISISRMRSRGGNWIVRIDEAVLKSDDAIVAVFCHEMWEVRGISRLVSMYKVKSLPAAQLQSYINRLHNKAVLKADALVQLRLSIGE